MSSIISLYSHFVKYTEYLQPAVLLVIRLWISWVFFASGLVKIDDFDTTVALFKDEYAVPLIPPYLAAVSATFFELTCPVLITLGIVSRLAALPLLAMTAVIQLTYDQNIQHAYWAMLLLIIVSFGAGRFSADYIFRRIGYNQNKLS